MLRTAQFKYIKNEKKNVRRGGSEEELYDLTKDPLEMHNLAGDPTYAATLKELAAQHDAWQKDVPPVPVLAGIAPEPLPGATTNAPPAKAERRRKRQPATDS